MFWIINLTVVTFTRRVRCLREVFAYSAEEAETEALAQVTGEFAAPDLVLVRAVSVHPLEMAVL